VEQEQRSPKNVKFQGTQLRVDSFDVQWKEKVTALAKENDELKLQLRQQSKVFDEFRSQALVYESMLENEDKRMVELDDEILSLHEEGNKRAREMEKMKEEHLSLQEEGKKRTREMEEVMQDNVKLKDALLKKEIILEMELNNLEECRKEAEELKAAQLVLGQAWERKNLEVIETLEKSERENVELVKASAAECDLLRNRVFTLEEEQHEADLRLRLLAAMPESEIDLSPLLDAEFTLVDKLDYLQRILPEFLCQEGDSKKEIVDSLKPSSGQEGDSKKEIVDSLKPSSTLTLTPPKELRCASSSDSRSFSGAELGIKESIERETAARERRGYSLPEKTPSETAMLPIAYLNHDPGSPCHSPSGRSAVIRTTSTSVTNNGDATWHTTTHSTHLVKQENDGSWDVHDFSPPRLKQSLFVPALLSDKATPKLQRNSLISPTSCFSPTRNTGSLSRTASMPSFCVSKYWRA